MTNPSPRQATHVAEQRSSAATLGRDTGGGAALPALVGIATVARSLGITERHVRRLVAQRRIPFVQVGYFVRFDPIEVVEWVDERRVEADAGRPRAKRDR